MATALGCGYPVAFALPGSAIITILLAGITGYLLVGDSAAYFHQGGPFQWLSSGVTNLRGVYWEVERDTLIAIPLFIFMGIMLQKSKIAEDLLVVMANLFGPVPGGLGISVVFVGALLAATTGIVGATVVAMGLISLPAMLRNNYSKALASGTIAASGTLGQIIPPSIVLIILADQLSSASDQAGSARKLLHKEATGEISMPSMFEVGSTSAGEMFLGALIPGLVLVAVYMLFILVYAMINPKAAPAVRYEGQMDLKFWGNVALTLIPPLGLIFLVLGSIITGIATVNQAGAIGASGALIMAGYRLTEGLKGRFNPAIMAILSVLLIAFCLSNYNMNIKAILVNGGDATGIWLGLAATFMLLFSLVWSGIRVLKLDNILHSVMLETAKTTSLVFIILLGAAMLTAAFRAFGGEELVRNFLNSMPGGFWAKFGIVMAVIFVLGFFLDFIEIAVVVVPIVAPILLADPSANITAVWLGVMIGLNIQTSFLTPPFGFALFYLRGVAPPSVKTLDIYKGAVAFICLQLLALGIVGYYPQLVNYLPNRVSLLSESSPPPRNPKLQICLEEYSMMEISDNRADITSAIYTAQSLDTSFLPKKISSQLNEAFGLAEVALSSLEEVFTAEEIVANSEENYRPILVYVRGSESSIRRAEGNAKILNDSLAYLKADADVSERERVLEDIASIELQVQELKEKIPNDWDATYGTFSKLVQTENKARMKYRRSADQSVLPVTELVAVFRDNSDFSALSGDLLALEAMITQDDAADVEIAAKTLAKAFSAVKGASKVSSALKKVARQLRAGKVNLDKASSEYKKALKVYQSQEIWRLQAEGDFEVALEVYLSAMSASIGARQQEKLTRDQALYIAKCNAVHRDVSLNF
jgi:tripartite ATP-independent transporter DctM subunit